MTDYQVIAAGELRTAGFPGCLGCAYFRTGPAPLCQACAEPELVRPGPDACDICAQRLRPGGTCPNELCRTPRRRIAKIHAIGMMLLGDAMDEFNEHGERIADDTFLVLLNASAEAIQFAIPRVNTNWEPLISSQNLGAINGIKGGDHLNLEGRSGIMLRMIP